MLFFSALVCFSGSSALSHSDRLSNEQKWDSPAPLLSSSLRLSSWHQRFNTSWNRRKTLKESRTLATFMMSMLSVLNEGSDLSNENIYVLFCSSMADGCLKLLRLKMLIDWVCISKKKSKQLLELLDRVKKSSVINSISLISLNQITFYILN